MYLRKYETVAIVNPDAGTDGVQRVLDRMREAITKTGGQEARLEDWGRRRLAFEMAKQNKGHYLYLLYLGTTSTVAELERLLGITEEAMKYQTVLLDPRVKADEFDFEKAKSESTQHARSEAASPLFEDDEDESDDEEYEEED